MKITKQTYRTTRRMQYLVIIGAIVLPLISYSQGEDLIARMIPKPVPTSPNAAGLGK